MNDMPRVWVAGLLLVVGAACGPSKAEREAHARAMAEQEAQEKRAEAERKSLEPRLQALADAVRAGCAADFKRMGAENLGAGPDAAADCQLPKTPVWRLNISSTRSAPAELGEAMVRECEELQKELDLAVKRAGPGNPSSSRDSDARDAIARFEKTVLVGLVYERRVFPEVVKDASGTPKSFKPGLFDGTAYLFPVSAAKVTCASRVTAKSSEKVEYAKLEVLGAEGTAGLDVDDDLEANIGKALDGAARASLAPVPKPEPAKPAAKAKAKPKKKKR